MVKLCLSRSAAVFDDVLVQFPASLCAIVPSLSADVPCPSEDIGLVRLGRIRHSGARFTELLHGFPVEGKKPNMLRAFEIRIFWQNAPVFISS